MRFNYLRTISAIVLTAFSLSAATPMPAWALRATGAEESATQPILARALQSGNKGNFVRGVDSRLVAAGQEENVHVLGIEGKPTNSREGLTAYDNQPDLQTAVRAYVQASSVLVTITSIQQRDGTTDEFLGKPFVFETYRFAPGKDPLDPKDGNWGGMTWQLRRFSIRLNGLSRVGSPLPNMSHTLNRFRLIETSPGQLVIEPVFDAALAPRLKTLLPDVALETIQGWLSKGQYAQILSLAESGANERTDTRNLTQIRNMLNAMLDVSSAAGAEERFEVSVRSTSDGTENFDRIELMSRSEETDRLANALGLIKGRSLLLIRQKAPTTATEAFPFFAVSDGAKVILLSGAGSDGAQLWRSYAEEKIKRSIVFSSMRSFRTLESPVNVQISSPLSIPQYDLLQVTISAGQEEKWSNPFMGPNRVNLMSGDYAAKWISQGVLAAKIASVAVHPKEGSPVTLSLNQVNTARKLLRQFKRDDWVNVSWAENGSARGEIRVDVRPVDVLSDGMPVPPVGEFTSVIGYLTITTTPYTAARAIAASAAEIASVETLISFTSDPGYWSGYGHASTDWNAVAEQHAKVYVAAGLASINPAILSAKVQFLANLEPLFLAGQEETYFYSPAGATLKSNDQTQPDLPIAVGDVFRIYLAQKRVKPDDRSDETYLLRLMENGQLALMERPPAGRTFSEMTENEDQFVQLAIGWDQAHQRGERVTINTLYGPVSISLNAGKTQLAFEHAFREENIEERIGSKVNIYPSSLYDLGFNRLIPAVGLPAVRDFKAAYRRFYKNQQNGDAAARLEAARVALVVLANTEDQTRFRAAYASFEKALLNELQTAPYTLVKGVPGFDKPIFAIDYVSHTQRQLVDELTAIRSLSNAAGAEETYRNYDSSGWHVTLPAGQAVAQPVTVATNPGDILLLQWAPQIPNQENRLFALVRVSDDGKEISVLDQLDSQFRLSSFYRAGVQGMTGAEVPGDVIRSVEWGPAASEARISEAGISFQSNPNNSLSVTLSSNNYLVVSRLQPAAGAEEKLILSRSELLDRVEALAQIQHTGGGYAIGRVGYLRAGEVVPIEVSRAGIDQGEIPGIIPAMTNRLIARIESLRDGRHALQIQSSSNGGQFAVTPHGLQVQKFWELQQIHAGYPLEYLSDPSILQGNNKVAVTRNGRPVNFADYERLQDQLVGAPGQALPMTLLITAQGVELVPAYLVSSGQPAKVQGLFELEVAPEFTAPPSGQFPLINETVFVERLAEVPNNPFDLALGFAPEAPVRLFRLLDSPFSVATDGNRVVYFSPDAEPLARAVAKAGNISTVLSASKDLKLRIRIETPDQTQSGDKLLVSVQEARAGAEENWNNLAPNEKHPVFVGQAVQWISAAGESGKVAGIRVGNDPSQEAVLLANQFSNPIALERQFNSVAMQGSVGLLWRPAAGTAVGSGMIALEISSPEAGAEEGVTRLSAEELVGRAMLSDEEGVVQFSSGDLVIPISTNLPTTGTLYHQPGLALPNIDGLNQVVIAGSAVDVQKIWDQTPPIPGDLVMLNNDTVGDGYKDFLPTVLVEGALFLRVSAAASAKLTPELLAGILAVSQQLVGQVLLINDLEYVTVENQTYAVLRSA